MQIFALVDCNNFYASCERVFNPRLENKPIVILSNNDGCIIARSNEAKQLGIPMGAPYFQWQKHCEQNNIHVFSSNYELYGDLSARVMSSLEKLCPEIEIYSIDEAFLRLDAWENYYAHAVSIKKLIKQWTGIPVSIGISTTKTLAKCANKLAKNENHIGVFDLTSTSQQNISLNTFPVKDIWGVGRQLTQKLNAINIFTAKELRDYNQINLRQKFNITMEKINQELNGISCLPLENLTSKKQIISSRSFGKKINNKEDLSQAISHYTAIACVKLRKQKSTAAGIMVFLDNGSNKTIHFSDPSDDTGYLISMANKCLDVLYKPGIFYKKAGIMLLEITSRHVQQLNLLSTQPPKSKSIMTLVDHINESKGKNAIFFCAEGTDKPWKFRREHRSPRYTTAWNELAVIQCK